MSANLYAGEASRRKAVAARDAAADGAFVFAVKTTGVYCRPSCSSRTAKPNHISFYSSCDDAERAGYRACKRCKPRAAPLAERRRDLVIQACRIIESSREMPGLEKLAAKTGLSQFHFHRLFKSITGVTPRAYAMAHRGRKLRGELERGRTVAQAASRAGYGSNSRLYATSPGELGMKPTQFQKDGDDVAIQFAIGESTLGSVLVAATEKGLCALFLGGDPEDLVRNLQDRFRRAQIEPGDRKFHRRVAAAIALVERPGQANDLPLDIRGTAFQRGVWEALRSIPAGSMATYAEIARRIGRPPASRAVAAACAANPVAVIVPCHRVVRTDESLSGYRWGVERKAELLRREGSRR